MKAPGSFLTPHSLSEQSSRNSGPVSVVEAIWKSQNLTLRGAWSLIRAFINVWQKKLVFNQIHLCGRDDAKPSDFGLRRFVKPPTFLTKTAPE